MGNNKFRTSNTDSGVAMLDLIPEAVLNEAVKAEMDKILEYIQEGVFITDGEANILYLNQASVNLSCYTAKELIGRNVRELLEEGYFAEDEVTTLLAIENGGPVSRVQRSLRGEYDLVSTSIPYYKNGVIERVITTERDVSQLLKMEEDLRKTRKLAEKYKNELDYYRNNDNKLVDNIIYQSEGMKKVVDMALKIAKQDVTVLLQGESGVGKEVVAKLISKHSNRREKPFIKINCGAIPENLLESELFGYERGAFTGASEKGKPGLFELANGGTLFLDEIGTLPMQMQVKLLRAIQEKEITRVGGSKTINLDIRIISATNTDLIKAVRTNQFRNDLYYRLNVFPIFIAPLRERKEDIPYLAESFLDKFNSRYNCLKRMEDDVVQILLKYDWPGNVRELENMIERLILTSDEDKIPAALAASQLGELTPEDNWVIPKKAQGLKKSVAEYEKKIILANLTNYKTMSELAQALGIDKSTLCRKMKEYRISGLKE